ncbi:toll-like receptor 7 [Lethenteron reissneri]|uniref:toll-like receptor 7 n=1 Tax=Lethenteron reissneri TaxID=7753 RepID=UPI002AB5FD95|nr:toll-like receptor 7 [Lethenteron reissneri]
MPYSTFTKLHTAPSLLLLHLLLLPRGMAPIPTQTRGGDRSWPRTLPCEVDVVKETGAITVDCSGLGLTHVPFGIPKHVTQLNLSNNNICGVQRNDFIHFQDTLRDLDLSGNCPSSVTSPNCPCDNGNFTLGAAALSSLNLSSLNLGGNSFSRVPSELPRSLHTLNLQFNRISQVFASDFEYHSALSILHLGYNCFVHNPCGRAFGVEPGAFSAFNLSELHLPSNNVSNPPTGLPAALTLLDLSGNQLRTFEQKHLSDLSSLRLLDLSMNCPRCYNAPYPCHPCPDNGPLNITHDAFFNVTELRSLNLRSVSLRSIPSQMFKNNPHLTHLDLSLNYLAKALAEGSFLLHLKRLEVLDLSFNYEPGHYFKELNLSSHFAALTSLKKLMIKGYVFERLEDSQIDVLHNLSHLTSLDLGINFINHLDLAIFKTMSGLSSIFLSQNQISPPVEKRGEGLKFGLDESQQVPGIERIILDDRTHSITSAKYEECKSYGKLLDLSVNNIFFINPMQFKGAEDVHCLNLSTNAIGQTLNGSEFVNLPNLKYLDLSFNRLDLFHSSALTELKSLEVLDLSYNRHYFSMDGIVHNINFISNMTSLRKLNLGWNGIKSLGPTRIIRSHTLTDLYFDGNNLNVLWEDGNENNYNVFENLTHIKVLNISYNNLNSIPNGSVLLHLRNIQELIASHNHLNNFPWDELRYMANLSVLSLDHNHLDALPISLLDFNISITKLSISHNHLTTISRYFLLHAPSLAILDVSYNKIAGAHRDDFPRDALDHLQTLMLEGNPFLCTCENIWLAQWINSTDVNIPHVATGLLCDRPDGHRHKSVLVTLDFMECEFIGLMLGLFLLYNTIILLLMGSSFVWARYRWDVAYTARFYAARCCRGHPNGGSGSNGQDYRKLECGYDAFVAYDSSDMDVCEWVLQEMRVHMEEAGPYGAQCTFRLCLEDRDWVPGMSVADNLVASVHASRRTVFVLTRSFAASGRFREAFLMSHQRLLDEKVDMVILVMLERMRPSFTRSRYMRLRQRLSPGSILRWPTNPHAQKIFWQGLRDALAGPSKSAAQAAKRRRRQHDSDADGRELPDGCSLVL